ncbi:pyruvate kinase [Patescibacteria group bacterium]|nr:pyruvate kinase [Patescibacteria group bacterium]MBU0879498.1 pyruvate kinase [Patescibacteria group bacterium]MBU0880303.1 pyruvate kinase [Patescibacteria group bacterium]MBU1783156.1 pyruvate kinase [Patescibacteria group bacterium]MBU1991644.1 pyruvate kinase [Patescibacteria group bacterium]
MNPKIVANVGRRSGDYEILKKMALAGMKTARLNFAYASNDQLIELKANLAQIEKETGIRVKILQDLCGPRIRVGVLAEDIHMKEGEEYTFSFDKCDANDKTCISIDSKDLINDLEVGHPFYLVNGAIEMTITKIEEGKIYCKVERGGLLSSKKGINLPKTNLAGGGLTAKDEIDAKFGAEQKVDFIGLSFVQSEEDIRKLRKIIGKDIKIIAKIERGTAMPVIDKIIRESDGIMIARGDLGIEMPLEELPILQKELIRHAHWHQKSAMVATQVMLSMVEKSHPTYAEVTDVANAVFDGADTIMLSDETAVGKYPVECITIVKKIINKADEYFNKTNYWDEQ